MKKELTCSFTGHRENKLPWRGDEDDPRCARLKERIYKATEELFHLGVRHYICGMASGCDVYFCEAVLRLRAEHPEVTLEAAIPSERQIAEWGAPQRERYDRCVGQCDYQTVIQQDYTPDCMMRRNRYMVDSSAYLIVAYNGSHGGTENTLFYAMQQGVQIIQLPMEE